MATPHEAQHRRRSCNAVSLLSRTVRTLRQHDCVPRLPENALARCKREFELVLADDDLVVELAAGEVRCGGQAVLLYSKTDVPFGMLAAAGVGEFVIAQGTPSADLERMIRLLAAAPGTPDPDYDITATLRAAHLPGLQLRAPSSAADSVIAQRNDWWLLPEPMPDTDFQRYVERESEASLPGRSLQLLLADLEADDVSQPVLAMLVSLLDAMLGAGDAAGAAVLLEQADHRTEIPAMAALQLRRRALQAFEGEWLLTQLEHEHRIHGLVALGLQLGDESIDRLSAAANTIGIPLPAWVSSILPPGE